MKPKNVPNQKPLIGISLRLNPLSGQFYLPVDYAAAVIAAGGVPIHLGLFPTGDYIQNVLNSVDAILLPGGGDIDPLRFGAEPKPGLGTVSPLRDESDLKLLAVAEEMNLPVLGICYGMQILNVFRGGSVFQDIEREKPDSLNHRQGEPRERRSHWIEIAEKSVLFEPNFGTRILVNSHHHQAVDRIGLNLKVTAVASDGIVEAIEDTRGERFNLGVQWHPEIEFQNDEYSQLIFKKFITAASRRQSINRF